MINLDKKQITPAMKDFILGSEEFLIHSQERVEEFFVSRGSALVREDWQQEDQGDGGVGGLTTDAVLMILNQDGPQSMPFLI
jgi:hypothetical protein